MAKGKKRRQKDDSTKMSSGSQRERAFELDWGPISTTRQGFQDVTCILPMLCTQLRGETLDADEERSQNSEVVENDSDFEDEAIETWESDSTEQHGKEKSPLAEAKLKNRFLDRLAEVLAKIKKRPEGVKQVASAYMAEMDKDDGSQCVEIRLAKNEGLSSEDEEYLKMLFGVLMQIARGGSSPEKAQQTLLQQTIDYARPRIDSCVESLRREFGRTPQLQPSDPSKIQKLVATATRPSAYLKSWSDDAWRGYNFTSGGSGTNDRAGDIDGMDKLSCEARENSCEAMKRSQDLTSLFQNVSDFCKVANPPNEDLAEIMESAFILQTDVRSRAGFQGCFLRHFGLAYEAAARAQRALLFLCRFYAAVLAFTEAAARLPPFRNMSFKLVEPFSEVLPSKNGMKERAAKDVIAGLSVRSSEACMARLCRWKRKTKTQLNADFNIARHEPCHVHAEIQLVDNFENEREKIGWRTHPYIGSSKLCCFLCDSFLRHHGFFQYRGTHWKLYHKWQVPEAFKTREIALVFRNSLQLVYHDVTKHINEVVTGEAKGSKSPLRPESTVDLSTAATVSTREMTEMTLASPSSKWMGKGAWGPMATDDAILSVPNFEKPGYTNVSHKGRILEMSIEDAETYKDRFERLKLVPKVDRQNRRRCHRLACQITPAFRCKACRASYCSRKCQNFDWHRHVFVCTVRGRPNLADSLVLLMRDAGNLDDTESQDMLRKSLFADREISVQFGFSGCETSEEVNCLISIYGSLTARKRSALLLQDWVGHGELEGKIRTCMLAKQNTHLSHHEQFPVLSKWFRRGYADMDAHVEYGLCRAIDLLMPDGLGHGNLNDSEHRVLQLYSYLLKDFDNLPDRSHPVWLDFGFCFCPSREWMRRMADAYMELATKASSSEIINSWSIHNCLDGLFDSKGLDINTFKAAGISFGRPTKMERGVYRLMMEINHVHRGKWCQCENFQARCCKRFPELRFSAESVMEYGFDQLSPWERWQMIVMWEDIFNLKNFHAREMLAARRSDNGRALQDYVERMIDTRRYWNKYKTGALFPDLRGRLIWETSVMPLCFCICH